MKEEQIYKVVTVGEGINNIMQGRVGKTSLILRFVNNKFKEDSQETIEAYYLDKTVNIKNHEVKLSIWDTAGQEKYNALAPVYYKNADVAIIVYDVTVRETVDKAKKWIRELKQYALKEDIIFVIVGNKSDLAHEIDVDQEFIKQICTENNAKSFLSSAKNSKGINEIFQYIGEQLIAKEVASTRNRGRTGTLKAENKQDSVMLGKTKAKQNKSTSCC
ncbi:hypothetical protein pb186bvf_011954 [Paramecium bursaria]